MKKTCKVLALGMVAAVALTASAAAANFDHCADSLKNMGLFSGGDNGYELDKAPTRAEAATMLVRLLGKDAEAKALTYSAPFTDLTGWEQPYVQYLYENGLTSGATATTFEPEGKCDAQMYATFLLRALGYSDKDGDFTYATALAKAGEVGVVNSVNCDPANFLRDDVAAMSYTALATPSKGSTDVLLSKLVADGAVTADAAKPTLDLINAYTAYNEANTTLATANKTSMKADLAVGMKVNGEEAMNIAMNLDIAADMDLANLNKSKMAMTGDMAMTGALIDAVKKEEPTFPTSAKLSYYYTDGNYYMDMAGQKVMMPMDFSGMQSMANMSTQFTGEPIVLFKSLTAAEKDGTTTYNVSYAPGAFNSLIDSTLASMNLNDVASLGTITVNKVDFAMSVKDKAVTGMSMDMGMGVSAQGETADLTMKMTCSDIKTGDSVKVTLPGSFEGYTAAQ